MSVEDDDKHRADVLEATRQIAENARSLERELIAMKLEGELFETSSSLDEHERAWRKGWNARTTSIVKELRGGR